jgi:hypothetical protein
VLREIGLNEAAAVRRRLYFDLINGAGDPVTAETGQPQISTDGAGWTATGIGALVEVGSGAYYADLTTGAVDTVGRLIRSRYKSANTIECPGDAALVLAYDPYTGVLLPGATSGGSSDAYLYGRATTGSLTTFLLLDHLGRFWNNTLHLWETWNGAHINDYRIDGVEIGTTGNYIVASPTSGVAGEILFCKRTGGGGTLVLNDVRNPIWGESVRPAANSVMKFLMDGNFRFDQFMNLIGATIMGKTEGAGTSQNRFKSVGGNVDRVVTDFDPDTKNRAVVAYTPPA